jgi:anti-sigma B factor antagonist
MDYVLEMKSGQLEDYYFLKLSGEIDIFNSAEFKQALLNMIDDGKYNLKIDCSDLNYIDSTGLSVLITILKKVRSYDGWIYLLNLKPNLIKLFEITNLDKVFMLSQSEEAVKNSGDFNE